jgi:predicted pyridoxine 5'-phosphate oxidase superfamily flavin-nucleotide-binding protein
MREAIEKAIRLGGESGRVFVATADADGLPHMAVSGKISIEEEGLISVSEWFCPGTLSNLIINPRIALVVWYPVTDMGFQILGNSEKVEEISMLDGFLSDAYREKPLPQVERRIFIRVEKVMNFSHAPHSDVEE